MAQAGSITVTTSKAGGLTKYSIAWTSDAAGAVSENSFDVHAGELVQVEFIPNTDADQPTNLYDLVLNDADSIDVLAGGGANLVNNANTVVVPVVSTYFRRTLEAGALTPGITNAGNAKKGTIVLLVSPR